MKKALLDFVIQKKEYFWDCDISQLSDLAILERLINYAELDEIKKFVRIIGFSVAKLAFYKIITKKRINILSIQLLNYFYLFFGLQNEVSY